MTKRKQHRPDFKARVAGTMAVDQLMDGPAFRRARRDRHISADYQPVAVLYQRMPYEIQSVFPDFN